MEKKNLIFGVIVLLLFVNLGILSAWEFDNVKSYDVIEKESLVEPTYTPTSKTICEDGICNAILYSGTQFVYEDNKWKDWTDARSLKDKGFEIKFLETDKEFPLEIVDFNATSITAKLNPKGISIFNKDVPIRVWEENIEKEEQFVKDLINEKVISKGVDDYKEKMDLTKEELIKFNLLNQEEEIVYNFKIGDVLEFGYNSTTVTLEQARGIIKETGFTREANPTLTYTQDKYTDPTSKTSSNNQRGYFWFNLSELELTSIIEADFVIHLLYVNYDSEIDLEVTYCNDTFDHDTLTWNNQDTEVINCNATAINSDIDYSSSGWVHLNLTHDVSIEINDDQLFTTEFKMNPESTTESRAWIDGTLADNESLRPYLNITYEEPDAVPNVTLNSPADSYETTNPTITFNCSAYDDVEIANVSLLINDTIVSTNSSGVNDTDYIFEYTLTDGTGSYNWTCSATDNNSATTTATARDLTYSNDLTISLNSPIDYYNSSSSSITFNGTGSDDTAILNVSLILDGEYNETNSSGVNNTDYIFTKTIEDGEHNWTYEICDTIACLNASVRYFTIDATDPNINITYPIDEATYTNDYTNNTNVSITIQSNTTDDNLDSCWVNYYQNCSQEFANISTSCGGLSTGNYSSSGNWNDGDWTTRTIGNFGDLYINYTLPQKANKAYLIIGNYYCNSLFECSYVNSTTLITEFYNNQLELKINSSSQRTFSYYYKNSSGNYSYLGSIGSIGISGTAYLVEEKVNWFGEDNLNCSGNTTIELPYGTYDFTFFSNDTFGNIASEEITATWDYSILENNVTYTTPVVEGESNNFRINLDYNSDNFLLSGNLIYNGTSYAGTDIGSGDNGILSRTINAPNVITDTNYTFYWEIGLTNSTGTYDYNSSTYTQLVGQINMSETGSPHATPFINFTTYDEQTLSELNATLDLTFHYKIKGGLDDSIYSFTDSTENNSQWSFAFDPADKTYVVDATIEVDAVNYTHKFYNFENMELTNTTTSMNFYLLPDDDSTTFLVVVRDSSYIPLDGVEVYVQRYYPSTNEWNTIEISETNDEGKTTQHFYTEDAIYRFKVYSGGTLLHTTEETLIFCEETPCTVEIIIPETFENVLENFEDLDDLTTSLSYNEDTQDVTYTYTDTSGNFTQGRLYVIRLDFGNSSIDSLCNTTSTDSTSILTCDLTGETNGTYIASGYITREDETLAERISLKKIISIVENVGVDGVLWSIFLLVGIMMLGVYRPSLGIIFGAIGVVLLGLLSIVSIPITATISIIGIAIILLMGVKKQ